MFLCGLKTHIYPRPKRYWFDKQVLKDKVELPEIHPLPTEAKLSLKSDLSVEEELKLSKIKVSQLENKIRAQWCIIESNADVLNSKEKKINNRIVVEWTSKIKIIIWLLNYITTYYVGKHHSCDLFKIF